MGLFDIFGHSSVEKVADECHSILHQLIVVNGLSDAANSYLFRTTGSRDIQLGYSAELVFLKNDREYALYKLNSYDAFVVIGELDAVKSYKGRTDKTFLAGQEGNLFISSVSLEAAQRLDRKHKDTQIFR